MLDRLLVIFCRSSCFFEKGFPLAEKPGLDAKVSAHGIGYVFAVTETNVVKLVLRKKWRQERSVTMTMRV